MANIISSPLDSEEELIRDQLAQAAALRKVGMQGNTGAGMAGNVYVRGNPWGNIVSGLAGVYMDSKAREKLAGLEQARTQERDQFMAAMPSGVETVPQAGPVMPGEAPLPDVERQMSPRALARATQQWAARAPRGMEGVQNFALQRTMLAPEREAELAAQAEARRYETDAKAAAIAAENKAKRDWQEEQNAIYKRTADQQTAHLAAAIAARGAGGGKAPTAAELKRQDAAEAKEESRSVAGGMLNQLDNNLDELEKSGGIPSNKKGALSNAVSSLRNSFVGQAAGSTFGTKDQANRNDNESIATGLLMELKNLKGLSASQMNSNMELQRYLTAIKGGTNYDVETMRKITGRARDLLGVPKGETPTAPTPATESPKRRKYNPATGDFE